MILLILSVFWILGIYLGSLLQIEPLPAAAASIVLLAIGLLAHRHPRVVVGAACAVALMLGAVRYESALPPTDYGSIALHISPRAAEIGGVIVAEPDVRDTDIRLVVSTYHIGYGEESFKVNGAIQVRVPRYSTYRYGDDLLIKGVLVEPPEFDAFSYKRYLLRQGIYAIVYDPTIDIVARDEGNPLLARLYAFKQRLLQAIVQYLPEPQAGLTEGVLLGVKAVITDDLNEDLTRTGMAHIIVVSGYNLTVVAILLQRLTEKRLSRSLALLVAMAGVLTFTVMTGASTPVVRAAIMVSMALLARASGRESDALTSVLFTGAVLLAFNPLTLWDVGFQLSFMATLGLVLFAEPLASLLQGLPLGIGTVLGTTLAAQITTLPIIAFNFQRISLVSPLANLLVEPAIPLLMLSGGVLAIAGLTGHALVRVVGWVAWLFGTYIVEILHRLSDLRWASIPIPILPLPEQIVAIVVYFALFGLVFYIGTHVRRRHLEAILQRAKAVPPAYTVITLAFFAVVVWLMVLFSAHKG